MLHAPIYSTASGKYILFALLPEAIKCVRGHAPFYRSTERGAQSGYLHLKHPKGVCATPSSSAGML